VRSGCQDRGSPADEPEPQCCGLSANHWFFLHGFARRTKLDDTEFHRVDEFMAKLLAPMTPDNEVIGARFASLFCLLDNLNLRRIEY
jgi:hypothetical protein